MFRKETGVNFGLERKYLDKDRYLKDYYNYENRIDDIRSKRTQSDRRLEIELYQHELQKQNSIARRKRETEENELLKKIEKETAEKTLRDAKYRQYVRENSPELRELEAKLKSAYINKIREVQIAEKEYEVVRLKAIKYDEAKRLERDKEIASVENEIASENSYLQKLEYNKSLRSQLEEQQKQNEEAALLQFALDKVMIDEIVQKICEEDQRLYEEELQIRCQFQHDIQQFLLSQEVARLAEQKLLEEEKARVLQYVAEQDLKAKLSEKAKRKKQKFYEEMQQRLADLLQASTRNYTEEENLRYELASEEIMEKELAKEREAFEKRLRDRLQLQRTLENQLLEQADRAKKLKEENEKFKEDMLRKLREEEKIEQLSNQNRRRKELEHRRAVQEMIKERESRQASERQREAEELEAMRKAEEERQRIILEERALILRDHAVRLLGYLPKGTLKHKGELRALQESLSNDHASL